MRSIIDCGFLQIFFDSLEGKGKSQNQNHGKTKEDFIDVWKIYIGKRGNSMNSKNKLVEVQSSKKNYPIVPFSFR